MEAGEIFGIIGLSGAGKSTLVRCINLLEEPTSGKVFVNGLELTSLGAKELRNARRDIGMIFQGFNLLMQSSVIDNVCFPLRLAGVDKKAAREKALGLLETVGLADKANAFPAQLSGGQKQRVAIARALSTDPKVLLCDEATSALDPTTTRSILDLLQKVNRDLGVTVVVITHEMKVIEQICNRVAILSESQIVEMGPVEEIFRHPKTAAAKKLILPGFNTTDDTILPENGRFLRLVFDGQSAARPVISEMALKSGYPVSVVSADTKTIHGQTFGTMIVEIPDDISAAESILNYLAGAGVIYEEVK